MCVQDEIPYPIEDDYLNYKIIQRWHLEATPLIVRYLIK